MAWVGSTVTSNVLGVLNAPAGLNACLSLVAKAANVIAPPISQGQVLAQNVGIELAERASAVKYPVIHVYCERIVNQLREKFRAFSGKAEMAIEIRISQDNLDGIEEQMNVHIDAVTQVLDQNRGDWGEGVYYPGGYEAIIGPVKHGGRHFVQTGKVTFDVGVSN